MMIMMMMWKSVGLGKLLDRILSIQPQSLSYYEFKHHKTWLDKESSKLLDGRKQAKLQWLQNPSRRN
jgi:hypothetical protein